MDAGLMLNMLNGTAAANKPAAGGVFSITASNASSSTNASGNEFPAIMSAMNSQILGNSTSTPSGPYPVINMGEIMQSLSVSGTAQGVIHPAGAENILVQGNIIIDSETMQNILASNQALAEKLDTLIANGDVAGLSSIMQNITAIVKQINTGQFDISNLESIIGESGAGTTPEATHQTQAGEHSLRAVNAAANFEPIVNVQLDNTPTIKGELLPLDVLNELANLGQSPLVNTAVNSNGQSAQTPIATAVAAALTNTGMLGGDTGPTAPTPGPVEAATPTPAPVVAATPTSAPVAATLSKAGVSANVSQGPSGQAHVTLPHTATAAPNAQVTPTSAASDNVPAAAASDVAMVNKLAHNPVVNNTIEKDNAGLVVASAAAAKTAATSANSTAPTNPAQQPGHTRVEGAALPHQAALQAMQKSQAHSAAPTVANQQPSNTQAPIESGSNSGQNNTNQSHTNNQNNMGQSHTNGQSSSENGGQPQTGASSNSLTGHSKEHSTSQMTQDGVSQNQTDGKVIPSKIPLSHGFSQTTFHHVPAAEKSAVNTKIFGPDFSSDQSAVSSDVKSTQATLTPKPFGGSLSQGLAKDVAKQVGMEVSRQVSAGNSEFTVRLNPVELGKVTIKMAFHKDGGTSLRILAQSHETLALLQRDIVGLERAIESGGLKSDQSNISLELDNQHNGQSAGKALTEAARAEKAQENRDKASALAENDVAQAVETDEITPLEQILAQLDSANGLDIRV